MDASGWGLLIGVPIALVTLYYAIRSFQTGEQSLQLQRRIEREAKQANLEMTNPNHRGIVWRFYGFWPGDDDRREAYFESYVRNRGPAIASMYDITVFRQEEPILAPADVPEFLDVWGYIQLVIKIPLGPDISPSAEPIRVQARWADDDASRIRNWCFRFSGDATLDPESWGATELDCISLQPKQGLLHRREPLTVEPIRTPL